MFFKIKKLKKQVESQNKLTQNVLILPIFLCFSFIILYIVLVIKLYCYHFHKLMLFLIK